MLSGSHHSSPYNQLAIVSTSLAGSITETIFAWFLNFWVCACTTSSRRTTLHLSLETTFKSLPASSWEVSHVSYISKSCALFSHVSCSVLHDLKLIHTDLKPENILLVRNDYRVAQVPVPGKVVVSFPCVMNIPNDGVI